MLEQIKFGLKLSKYGLSHKMQMAFSIMCCVIGLALEFLDQGQNLVGGFYIVIGALFVMQMVISLDVSQMVQTSPYKKRLQTSMPILTCLPLVLGAYTIMVLIKGYYLYFDPQTCTDEAQRLAIKGTLEGTIVLIFLTTIYMGACFKYFLASMIALIFVIMPASIVFQVPVTLRIAGRLPFGMIVVAGYILIFLGALLSYLICKLLYKKELSRYAFGAAMRRAQK